MRSGLTPILGKVQKPGRYTGGEINSVVKVPGKQSLSMVLAYPDTYEVGMSYLGLRILYHLINERDDTRCERVFAPWADMEELIRRDGVRLFSLENKMPLNSFDVVGFSLSYELTYTNVLNMLDLGGITVRSSRRGEEEPLVVAGGSCCYNPEPMADFIDVFLIGDGEEKVNEFLDVLARMKRTSASRNDILRELSSLEGIYVPRFYRPGYSDNGFAGLIPVDGSVPAQIGKAVVKDLDKAYYPVKQIIPTVKIVHDRIAVEIMRGCPNRCRFCQASAVNRPLRIRKPDTIRRICRQTYENTGYERIALLSLSSVNYPYLPELVRTLNGDLEGEGIGITIPSLRVDEAFYDLPELMSMVRRSGLTFAPESASSAVREMIGKDIDMNVLCRSAEMAYRNGWRRLKLYFMVGFPGEPEDEMEGIIALSRKISDLKREVSKRSAEVKVSVNPFVPKAHTPFQWSGMKNRETLEKMRRHVSGKRYGKVDIEMHDIRQSLLEGCMSRGERSLGEVIYDAWKRGARMDGWRDLFRFDVWEKAFSERGLDISSYAERTYRPGDPLPWGHIRTGIDQVEMEEGFYSISGRSRSNPLF